MVIVGSSENNTCLPKYNQRNRSSALAESGEMNRKCELESSGSRYLVAKFCPEMCMTSEAGYVE